MDLIEKFNTYILVTKKIMEEVEGSGNYNELMKKRGQLINDIFSDQNSKEDVREIYDELKIKEIDETLRKSILNECSNIKKELDNIHNRKNASRVYGGNSMKVNYFNKQI